MPKVLKQHLDEKNWSNIFSELDNDINLVKSFIRGARKEKKIPANDLDSVLADLSKYTKSHIEITPSGVKFF